jgi:hypothetical protein
MMMCTGSIIDQDQFVDTPQFGRMMFSDDVKKRAWTDVFKRAGLHHDIKSDTLHFPPDRHSIDRRVSQAENSFHWNPPVMPRFLLLLTTRLKVAVRTSNISHHHFP